MKPDEIQSRIIADINKAGDCFSQYTYLLERAALLPEMTDEEKSRASLVDGCQSRVWLLSACEDGVMRYRASSDTLIVKGILALLIEMFSGQAPEDIVGVPLRVLRETDLGETLEVARANGASAMLRDIQKAAQANLAQGRV